MLNNTSSSTAGTVVYRVTPTFNGGCTGNYKDITVTVNARVTGGVVGSNQTICPNGDPAAFTQTTASTGPGTLNYQWQRSIDNIEYFDIAGSAGQSTTYNEGPVLMQTTYYMRLTKVTQNGLECTAYNSAPIVVTILPVSPGQIAGAQTVCNNGDPVAFTSAQAATGIATLKYQWQQCATPNGVFIDITGANELTYDPPALLQTTYYVRKVTSLTCSMSAWSNVVGVTVDNIDATITPSSASFCSDQSISANLTAPSRTATYQWKRDGITVSTGLSASYTATQIGSYTVTVTLPSGCTKTSAPATISQSNGIGSIRQLGNLCTDGYVDLRAGGNPVSVSNVLWSTGETIQTIRVYDPGTYSVTYTSLAGCIETASILVERIGSQCIYARTASPNQEQSEAAEEISDSKELTTHPNPANQTLTIELPSAVQESTPIVLYDTFGKISYKSEFKTGEKTKTIPTTEFVNGLYMLEVPTPNGGNVIRKVIISH